MGPQAAHMQQLQPRLRHPFSSWVAKKRGRQRPHGHTQPLAHSAEHRRIERQQHRVMRLCLKVGRKRIERTLAVVQVTAYQQPRTRPVTQPAWSRNASRPKYARVSNPDAAAATRKARTGLDQPGPLPERLKRPI
jgi:hypothetical protein